MQTILYLIPVLLTLGTALMRVHAIPGTRVEGKVEREVALTFRERLRYHRASLYALGVLLLLGASAGLMTPLLELVAVVAFYAVVSMPVRYRFTSAGVAINNVVFRRWSEFRGHQVNKRQLLLLGKPGLSRFPMLLAGDRQKPALAVVARRLSQATDNQKTPRRAGKGRLSRLALLLPVVALALTIGWSSISTALAEGPDPSGAKVGTAEDLGGIGIGGGQGFAQVDETGAFDPEATQKVFDDAKEKEPFAYNLAGYVNQNRLAINFMWVLITGYLVMFMQAGFALVETGFSRAKSAMHVMMTNFMVYGVGMLAYWAMGFAFQFGGVGLTGPTNLGAGLLELNKEATISISGTDWGLIGYKGFFLSPDTLDVGIAVLFLFQMVFMDTAATILTGTVAERWTWLSFLIWAVFVGALIYPIFGNWAWGGGWLFQLKDSAIERPYVDFAGSGVVHAVGGWAGLAAAWVLGPRLGKYNKDGSPNALPGHNLNMAVLGTFILAFGWFGFNPGSTLGASGSGNLRIGEIAVATMLAGSAASVVAMFYAKATTSKYDPGYMMNGMLGGLVAITAPSGYVSPISAVIIGAIAGALVCASLVFVERKLKVDDVVGAFSVHGVCGVWGMLAVGLFADGTAPDYLVVGYPIEGLFFGDGRQLLAQVVGVATVIVWAGGTSFVLFSVLKALGIFRSKPEDELAGLDLPEMGTHAYPLQDIPSGAPMAAGQVYGSPTG